MNTFKHFVLVFVLFFFMFVLGCGTNVPAGGRVSYESGKPLEKGVILFSDGQSMFRGDLRADGTFKLGGLKDGEGLPAGTYSVSIGGANEYEYTPDINPQIDYKLSVLRIDPKYETPKTSQLSVKVERGMKPIEIIVKPYPTDASAQK
jgi:hypothetical protein